MDPSIEMADLFDKSGCGCSLLSDLLIPLFCFILESDEHVSGVVDVVVDVDEIVS